MAEKYTATSSTTVEAEPERVWAVLTDLDLVSQAFFGAEVDTDGKPGSTITFSGEWEGKRFRDHGNVVRVEPGKDLQFTHFSPLSGQPDLPENYHVVTFRLRPADAGTEVTVSQTNAASEAERDHSQANWERVLGTLKRLAESRSPR